MTKLETPLDRAVRLCGGQTSLAEKIGSSQQLVSYWQNARKGVVPAEYVKRIEAAVDEQVTRHELRPDIFGEPEHAA